MKQKYSNKNDKEKKSEDEILTPTITKGKSYEIGMLRGRPGKLNRTNPSEILEKCLGYFKYCEDNPIYVSEPIKSGEKAGKLISIPKPRPFTMRGMCLFLGVSPTYFTDIENDLEKKKGEFNEIEKHLSFIVTCVREIIREQKYSHTVVGLFNPQVMIRDKDLDLREQIDITHNLSTVNYAIGNLKITPDDVI